MVGKLPWKRQRESYGLAEQVESWGRGSWKRETCGEIPPELISKNYTWRRAQWAQGDTGLISSEQK